MTWALFTALLGRLSAKVWGYVAAAGAIVLSVLIIFGKGKAEGKRVYREKQEKLNKQAAERTARIVNKIEDKGNDEIQRRLRKYYRD